MSTTDCMRRGCRLVYSSVVAVVTAWPAPGLIRVIPVPAVSNWYLSRMSPIENWSYDWRQYRLRCGRRTKLLLLYDFSYGNFNSTISVVLFSIILATISKSFMSPGGISKESSPRGSVKIDPCFTTLSARHFFPFFPLTPSPRETIDSLTRCDQE